MRELPPTWIETTVGDMFETVGGGTPSTAIDEYWRGTIPWISSADIDDAHHMQVSRFISPEAIKNSATNLVHEGSVIVVTRVGLGKVAVAETPLCFSQDHQALLIDQEHFDTKYVLYFMSQAVKDFRHISRGTTISGVTKKQLLETAFTLPPRLEQDRIVAEIEKQFTRLDAATAALKRVQANLKRYRASVLKAACEGRLVPTEAELARKEGRDYEPADKLLQRILRERRARWEADTFAKMQASGKPPKDDHWKQKYKEPSAPDTSNLPILPEGWCWASLDQLAVSVRNGISVKPTLELGLAILRISAVRAMSVNLSDVRFLPDDPEFRQYVLSENDLLFVRYNGNPDISGRCGRVGTTDRTVVHPDKLIRVDLCFKSDLSGWVEIVANFGVSRRHLELKTRTTAGQSGVSGEDIKRIPIPLCPLSEAVRIVAESDRLLSTQAVLRGEIERNEARSASIRQSILRDAFTGQLVPQDSTDEPASVLLERIRAERKVSATQKLVRRSRKEPVHA
jgi:type I restriction enzyme S subunit